MTTFSRLYWNLFAFLRVLLCQLPSQYMHYHHFLACLRLTVDFNRLPHQFTHRTWLHRFNGMPPAVPQLTATPAIDRARAMIDQIKSLSKREDVIHILALPIQKDRTAEDMIEQGHPEGVRCAPAAASAPVPG